MSSRRGILNAVIIVIRVHFIVSPDYYIWCGEEGVFYYNDYEFMDAVSNYFEHFKVNV